MNIFKQYGIREVADVTLYSIHRKTDGSDELYYVPALHLDTLKISTTEKNADSVWAEGGLGNGRLICWDFGRKIDVHLEDALCRPAQLSLCWSGILSSDWKNDDINVESSISINRATFNKLDRFEKKIFQEVNLHHKTIADSLPRLEKISIQGSGVVRGKIYNWKMQINSAAKSISIVPDRFWDVTGRYYSINWDKKMIIEKLPAYTNLKDAVIYEINNDKLIENGGAASGSAVISSFGELLQCDARTSDFPRDRLGLLKTVERKEICAANYLAVIVDNENEYFCLVGTKEGDKIFWAQPHEDILVSQFKGFSMWLKFQHLNTLIYYILTKYKDDIVEMPENHLWCYIDPQTMKPYSDDYWLDQGDIYYLYDLVFAPKEKSFTGNKITVKADTWPGMYMLVGETFIRERGDGEDEHMQIKFPFCKVKSNHSINLEAGGDPVVMTLDLEVARPKNNIMMELTTYETAPKLLKDKDGRFYAVDGLTDVLSE